MNMGNHPDYHGRQVTLAETSAIVDYILDQTPDSTFRSTIGSPQRVPYLYWSLTASMTPMLVMLFIGLSR